jgi:hypothetical protein
MRIEKEQRYPDDHVPSLISIAWQGFKSGRQPGVSGPDGFPVFADDPLKEFHLQINSYLTEAKEERKAWMIDPLKLPAAEPILKGSACARGRSILAGAARVVWHWKTPSWNQDRSFWIYDEGRDHGLQPLLATLFQAEFELTAEEGIELAKLLGGPMGGAIANTLPPLGVVMAVEKALDGKALPPEYKQVLVRFLRLLITRTMPPKQAAEKARIWRQIGAYERGLELDRPNQAFQRLAGMLVDEATLIELVEEMKQPLEQESFYVRTGAPLESFLELLESFMAAHPMPERVRAGLQEIQGKMEAGRLPKDEQRILGRIHALLGGPAVTEMEPGEAWSEQARADLHSIATTEREAWNRLLAHCVAADASKPTKKWLTQAGELLNTLGRDEFKRSVLRWFPLVERPRPIHRAATHPEWEADPDLLIADRNATILKGLVWCCTGWEDAEISRALSELAEVCFKKVRWLGPRCPRVGNACLYSLSSTASEESASELSKLDQVVKHPTAKKRIGKSLDKAAESTGQSRADLEEKSVPTFGLTMDGKLSRQFGRHTVELRIVNARDVELHWSETGGKRLKSVPADVKRENPSDLKQFQKLAKDIEKMLVAQRIRVERLLMAGREWDFESWRQRYLDQPLMAGITRRLIWHFKRGDQTALGAWHDGKLTDVNGRALNFLAPETRVRLWHPIGFPVDTVAAWRQWLQVYEVCQPFKQAHREIYVLTDAELATATYSNRFAAHILGQHQFAALCVQRGWKYAFMGGFDSHTTPTLELPQWDMAAEFWVEPAGGELASSGVAVYLATDQVRFVRAGESLSLADVPANVFTEVMRDVDLFVGVGSIGADPAWQDHGEIPGAGDYWRRYSFGNLNATAQTRKDVLEHLLPKLKIARQCAFDEKFLIVKGALRTYKIHLGSGNIQMEPNNQYLCIVPDRGAAAKGTDKIFLPFEGDRTLSVILSKAFLLAADTQIKDQSILSQIRI